MSTGGGGSSAPSQQTVTTSQQIPLFEQQYAQQNQDIAASLASQPYPTYQAPLLQGFTPTQQAGQQAAINASGAYQPDLAGAQAATVGALAGNPSNPGVIQSYMSPFVQAALTPQIQALNEQLGQQQQATNAQATGANAFGDARQGAGNALNNFYANQSLTGLLGQGYNQAYSNALQTATQQQQLGLQAGQQLGALGAQQQNLGLQGANAIYNVGAQQQALGQQGLNLAYQQYQNQVQWPYQNLNTRLSALSNSPYNTASQVTLPQANPLASNLGTFTNLAGLLGGGSGGTSSGYAPFGGSTYNPATATVA